MDFPDYDVALEKRTSMPERPVCVGCGYCCKRSICRTGAMIYGHYKDPCPSLISTDMGYKCGLYLSDPERFQFFLEIGEGCLYPLNPLRVGILRRREEDRDGLGIHHEDKKTPR
jgi:hypothetical protein